MIRLRILKRILCYIIHLSIERSYLLNCSPISGPDNRSCNRREKSDKASSAALFFFDLPLRREKIDTDCIFFAKYPGRGSASLRCVKTQCKHAPSLTAVRSSVLILGKCEKTLSTVDPFPFFSSALFSPRAASSGTIRLLLLSLSVGTEKGPPHPLL